MMQRAKVRPKKQQPRAGGRCPAIKKWAGERQARPAGATAAVDATTGAVLIGVAFLLGIGPYALMWRYDASLHPGGRLPLRRPGGRIGGIRGSAGTESIRRPRDERDREQEDGTGDPEDEEDRRRRLAESRRRRDGYPKRRRPPSAPTPVHVLPASDDRGRRQQKQPPSRLLSFLTEGIDASPLLTPARSPDQDGVVWIVDLTRIMCDDVVDEAVLTMAERMEAHRRAVRDGRQSPYGDPPAPRPYPDTAKRRGRRRFTSALRWTVYLLDFSDFGYVAEDDVYYGIDDLTKDCIQPLSDLLGRRNVFYASRQHVLGRDAGRNFTPGVVEGREEEKGEEEDGRFGPLGEVVDYGRMYLAHFMTGRVRQIDYGYRTLLDSHLREEAVKIIAAGEDGNSSDHMASDNIKRPLDGAVVGEQTRIDLASLPRPEDVAHFWKVGDDDNRTGVVRDAVNDALRSMVASDEDGNLRIYADQFGKGLGTVRSAKVTRPLARMLLRYKIVVVAQHDKYEGHYRLMDGLLSGALVMTDPVRASLPPYLEEGVSVVVYRGVADLRRLILRYLREDNAAERVEIGRRGRDVALRHHGPSAWVERIVFGNWSTTLGV